MRTETCCGLPKNRARRAMWRAWPTVDTKGGFNIAITPRRISAAASCRSARRCAAIDWHGVIRPVGASRSRAASLSNSLCRACASASRTN